jgi:hypothetical protein
MKIAHWALNVVLFCAAFICFYIAKASQDPAIGTFARVMTVVCGLGFLTLASFFTKYTIEKG